MTSVSNQNVVSRDSWNWLRLQRAPGGKRDTMLWLLTLDEAGEILENVESFKTN